MGQRAKHQSALIMAAAKLFRRHGYSGTGTNDILAASGAPRGSLYYYFPGGKEEIGAAAVEAAGRLVTKTLSDLAATAEGPADFVTRYVEMLCGWMAQSDFRDGCPISTVLLETAPQSERITRAGQETFVAWQTILEDVLRRHGWAEADCGPTATLILSAIEGALILARVRQTDRPLRDTAQALTRTLASPR